jgi:hypothetical protein
MYTTSSVIFLYWTSLLSLYEQILDMKESELNILATHLGHDAKTHKEFYRMSSATVELTTVCLRFNLSFDGPSLHSVWYGKSLALQQSKCLLNNAFS